MGQAWQTPHVLFDADEGLYKMWFVMSQRLGTTSKGPLMRQMLGYATSPDGRQWEVHTPSRSTRVVVAPVCSRMDRVATRMWMNSAPAADDDFRAMARHIYRFTSEDGLHWSRDAEPAIVANETHRSVVYPYVLENNGAYTMWYGCHVADGIFEIYASTSADGLHWTHHFERSAFPATRHPDHFDGRYTSTPCVLADDDRYLLYYSALRDQGNIYGAGRRHNTG